MSLTKSVLGFVSEFDITAAKVVYFFYTAKVIEINEKYICGKHSDNFNNPREYVFFDY